MPTERSVVSDAVFAARPGDMSYFCAYIVQFVAQGSAVSVVKRNTISSERRQSTAIPQISAGRTSSLTAQITYAFQSRKSSFTGTDARIEPTIIMEPGAQIELNISMACVTGAGRSKGRT